jgi:hypothetical protein
MIRHLLGDMWDEVPDHVQEKLEQIGHSIRGLVERADGDRRNPSTILSNEPEIITPAQNGATVNVRSDRIDDLLKNPAIDTRFMVAFVDDGGAFAMFADGSLAQDDLDENGSDVDELAIPDLDGISGIGVLVWEGKAQLVEGKRPYIEYSMGSWRSPTMDEWESLMRHDNPWGDSEDEEVEGSDGLDKEGQRDEESDGGGEGVSAD